MDSTTPDQQIRSSLRSVTGDLVMGVAILPVAEATWQGVQQHLADSTATAMHMPSTAYFDSQAPMFFIPTDNLTNEVTAQHGQPSLRAPLAQQTAAAASSCMTSYAHQQSNITDLAQHCSKLVMDLMRSASTVCFNSQGRVS